MNTLIGQYNLFTTVTPCHCKNLQERGKFIYKTFYNIYVKFFKINRNFLKKKVFVITFLLNLCVLFLKLYQHIYNKFFTYLDVLKKILFIKKINYIIFHLMQRVMQKNFFFLVVGDDFVVVVKGLGC